MTLCISLCILLSACRSVNLPVYYLAHLPIFLPIILSICRPVSISVSLFCCLSMNVYIGLLPYVYIYPFYLLTWHLITPTLSPSHLLPPSPHHAAKDRDLRRKKKKTKFSCLSYAEPNLTELMGCHDPRHTTVLAVSRDWSLG